MRYLKQYIWIAIVFLILYLIYDVCEKHNIDIEILLLFMGLAFQVGFVLGYIAKGSK